MTKTIDILVGTTSGNTEYLASELEKHLNDNGYKTQFFDAPILEEISFKNPILLCIATHGAGDYPESIDLFFNALSKDLPSLINSQFAMIAVGDSSYDTFCLAGKKARKLLLELGATELKAPLFIDMYHEISPEDKAITWVNHIF